VTGFFAFFHDLELTKAYSTLAQCQQRQGPLATVGARRVPCVRGPRRLCHIVRGCMGRESMGAGGDGPDMLSRPSSPGIKRVAEGSREHGNRRRQETEQSGGETVSKR
jgi:hypothetical protein